MDFNHHEFTDCDIWDPYNTMENHMLHNHPFDLTQCPNYPLIHHQDLQEPSNNFSSDHLLAASKLLERTNFEIEENQEEEEDPEEELGSKKEMMFKIASMQPVDIDPATIRKPKRRNVRISNDPQSIAARHRRERISEKTRILQRLVPGGMGMDTASMLDEAAKYVKFLKRQIRILGGQNHHQPPCTEATIAKTSAEFDLVALQTRGGASSYLFGGNNNGSGSGGEYHSICSNLISLNNYIKVMNMIPCVFSPIPYVIALSIFLNNYTK